MKKTTSEPDSAALSARCHRSAAVYHRGVHVGSSFLSFDGEWRILELKKEDHKRKTQTFYVMYAPVKKQEDSGEAER